jgi:GNAT superfamily N-acetyltransferase
VPALLEVFYRAVEDLDSRRGRTPQPRNAAPLELHFGHLLETDPHSCWVAEDHGRVVAFGMVMRRGDEAFLSFLFVEPAWQGRRLGRALLDACVRGAGEGIAGLSTCAEADQPVSTGLYARAGMVPRTPIYLLRGTLPDDARPGLPPGFTRRPVDLAMVATLDHELLGYERPPDHVFWARERQGVLFMDGAGTLHGYGYAHPGGRIGPVAAIDPLLLTAFVGELARMTQVLEGRQLIVPGPAIEALRAVLSAGLRIEGTPAVYCSEGRGPAFERYLPMSYALL